VYGANLDVQELVRGVQMLVQLAPLPRRTHAQAQRSIRCVPTAKPPTGP
jgi:hypothetical protein